MCDNDTGIPPHRRFPEDGGEAMAMKLWIWMAIGCSSVTSLAGAQCVAPAAGKVELDGVTARVDEITYASPRSSLRFSGGGSGLSWTINGAPVPVPPTPLGAGQTTVKVSAADSCGQPVELAAAGFLVDAAAPQLRWRVVEAKDLEGKVPDMASDTRYMWWWMQPEKRRLVWSDGGNQWAALRQYPGTRVVTSPGRTVLYVWSPDEDPFDETEADAHHLSKTRVLVLEASDDASGVGAVQVWFEADGGGTGATTSSGSDTVPNRLRLMASASDRVGNSTQVDLPYRTRR
jgi:hypothetical protein